MFIETKYDVGHTFWVPRVRKEIKKEEFHFEGENWYKDVVTYVPYVKQKLIVSIEARVGERAGIIYGVVTVDEGVPALSQYYPEGNITDYTEDEARRIAEDYAEQGKEYFGN
jgi:hypothetical protein